MNIETKYESKEFDYPVEKGKSQIVVECDIDTSDRGGITKIIKVTARPVVVRVDAMDGEAKVYGKLCYFVLYLNEDNNLVDVEYASDYVESVRSDEIVAGDMLSANIQLVDIDSMAKGDSIRLQAVLDIKVHGVEKCMREVLSSAEGALQKVDNINSCVHICHVDEKCDVSDEYATGANVDKILHVGATTHLVSTKTAKDSIVANGTLAVDILYSSEGKLVTKNMSIPYTEELSTLGVDSTSKAVLCARVASTKIVIGGLEGDNTIKVEAVLTLSGDVYEYTPIAVISDICSATHELCVTREELKYRGIVASHCSEERIAGSAEGIDSIKKVIAVIPSAGAMASARAGEDVVDVEILVPVSIVYIGTDEKYNVVDIDLPSSLSIDVDDVREDDEIDVHISVYDVSARLKREEDIDISADVGIEIIATRNVAYDVISAVSEEGEKPNRHKSLSLYFARNGESAWDIVRAMDVSLETLKGANPDIDFDHLEGGERIVVFRGEKR